MKSRDSKSSKKPYHRPRLLVYGDLRTLTQASTVMGKMDGAPVMGMMAANMIS
jgi:hypothetical protein